MRIERKYEGPCPVLKKLGRAAYKINILGWMKIRPVIHVNNLKQYHEDPTDLTQNQPTKRPIRANQWSSREPEEILAAKRSSGEWTKQNGVSCEVEEPWG